MVKSVDRYCVKVIKMNKIQFGDCRDIMRQWAVDGVKAQMCVTSPPYFRLRDYGVGGQIGLENTQEEYIASMVDVFRCVRDVLADDGTLWLNIGDTYFSGVKWGDGYGKSALVSNCNIQNIHTGGAKCKPKDLIGIPWMLALALRDDGWYLRQDIIWAKPNPMPESVRDRCTKSHEYVFLLSKSGRYFFDSEAIKEPAINAGKTVKNKNNNVKNAQMGKYGQTREGFLKPEGVLVAETRNRRSVWTVASSRYKGAHFATFPPALIEPCILAGSRAGDVVLDPFMGSGTTAMVAANLGRQYIGCELNETYRDLQNERIASVLVRNSNLFSKSV